MILGHSVTKKLSKNDCKQLSSIRAILEKPRTFWTPNGQYKCKFIPIQLNKL